jgi:hypothetical protein
LRLRAKPQPAIAVFFLFLANELQGGSNHLAISDYLSLGAIAMTSVHFPLRSTGWLALTLLAGVMAAGTTKAAPLPSDLALVPRDAAGFVHVRAADLWKSESFADVRHFLNRAGPESYKTFLKKVGPDPSVIDRITVVLSTPQTLGQPFPRVDPESLSALVIVRTSKPYDRLQLRKLLGQREKVYRRHLYHFNEDMWSGLVLIDKQTFAIGSEDAVVRFFDQLPGANAEGPLQDALTEAAGNHVVTVGLNPRLLGKEPGSQQLPPPLPKLLEARCATITLDLAKDTRVGVRLSYANDNEAQQGEKAVRGALDLARAALGMPIREAENELKKPAADGPVAEVGKGLAMLLALGFLRELDAQLKEMPVQRQGTTISLGITAAKRTDLVSMYALALGAITFIGERANVTFQTVGRALGPGKDPFEEHFKKITAAMDKYHQDKGTYPPPAIYDKDGRPILSWRVALLPYLGEEALYREFHLDEPWDSLHNKKLLKKLPQAFKTPDTYSRNKTTDLVFTGEAAAFTAKKGVRKADIAASSILLVATESDAAVYWSKPADLVYADNQPLPKLFGKYGFSQVKVLLANGTIKSLDRQTDEQTLRAMIKRAGAKKEK